MNASPATQSAPSEPFEEPRKASLAPYWLRPRSVDSELIHQRLIAWQERAQRERVA